MLTKTQRLEVENKVLRHVAERVRHAVARLDKEASEDVLDDIAVIVLKARIEAVVEYEDDLKRELDFAEHLLKEYPDIGSGESPQKKNPRHKLRAGEIKRNKHVPIIA